MPARLRDYGRLLSTTITQRDDRAGERCILCHMQAHPLYTISLE